MGDGDLCKWSCLPHRERSCGIPEMARRSGSATSPSQPSPRADAPWRSRAAELGQDLVGAPRQQPLRELRAKLSPRRHLPFSHLPKNLAAVRPPHQRPQPQLAIAHLGVTGDGGATPGLQARQQGPLGRHRGLGLGVGQYPAQPPQPVVVVARLQGQGPLADGRQHLLGGEPLGDARGVAQTSEIGKTFVSPQPSVSVTSIRSALYDTTEHVHGPHHGQLTTTRSPGMNEHGRTSSNETVCALPRMKRTVATLSVSDMTFAT